MRTKKMAGLGALALSGLLVAGGTALVAPPDLAQAQPVTARQSGTYAASVHQAFSQFEQQLNLTSAQKAQIKAILQKAVPQGRALHDNQSLPAAQKRARLQALRVATQARLQAVLTPAQRRQFAALRAGAGQHGRVVLQKLTRDLQLTPSQQARLKPVVTKTFVEIKSLHDDMSLTIPQKMDKLRRLHGVTQAQVKAVLTPAQAKKLKTIQSEIANAMRAEIMQVMQTQ